MDYPSTAKVKTGAGTYMADYQERYTGIKTPKWIRDLIFSKNKENRITKEEKLKISEWEKNNKVRQGDMYRQAMKEAQQEKNIARKIMTKGGTSKPRLSGKGGGGMMSPVKTPGQNRSVLSLPSKRKMNKGGMAKKGKK